MSTESSDSSEARLMAEVGSVVRDWASFEMGLGQLLAVLLKTDYTRAQIVLLNTRSFQAQKQLIERLAKPFLSDEQYDTLTIFLNDAQRLARMRNLLAHGMVVHEGSDPTPLVWKWRTSGDFGASIDGYYLDESLSEIRQNILELKEMTETIAKSLSPSTYAIGVIVEGFE